MVQQMEINLRVFHEDKSADWLAWRRQGIGSSDAPIVMGVSPYMTAYQLWEEKTGKVVKEEKTNFAMNKGNQLEPVARSKYELITGYEMPARMCEHYQYRFLRASLDGFCEELNKGIEVKYQGREVHESGIVPDKYMPQIQHQLYVSGAESIDFISYNPECNPDLKIVNVKPDIEWLSHYLTIVLKFWNENVLGDEPPELSDKDYVAVKDKDRLSIQYADLLNTAEETRLELEILREKILVEVGDRPRAIFGKLKIIKIWKKGNVNYRNIPELKGVDLEKFRGKSSSYRKISS